MEGNTTSVVESGADKEAAEDEFHDGFEMGRVTNEGESGRDVLRAHQSLSSLYHVCWHRSPAHPIER